MEEILAIRKKNSPPSPSKIKELLVKVSNIQIEKEKIFHKLEENELKICKLSKEVAALENEFEIEKGNLKHKQAESDRHHDLMEDLKKDKINQEALFVELDLKYKAMKKTKPSLKDCELLERGKRKLKLYKELTGIRWDYTCPEGTIEGIITDKKEFLQKISYKKVTDYKKVREALWEIIHQSTKEDSKENNPVN